MDAFLSEVEGEVNKARKVGKMIEDKSSQARVEYRNTLINTKAALTVRSTGRAGVTERSMVTERSVPEIDEGVNEDYEDYEGGRHVSFEDWSGVIAKAKSSRTKK